MSKILIIDDDRDFLESIKIVLEKEGHEIVSKYNTKEVLSFVKEVNPDLIILDVMFPEDESAGFEAARKIKDKEGDVKDIPILMLTAVNKNFPLGFSKKDVQTDLMPADDFLEKPVDFEVLLEKVKDLLLGK